MASDYDVAVIADGALHYWPMQETSGNIIDQVGTANGTPAGGIVYRWPGPAPGVYSIGFDGIAATEFSCGTTPFAEGTFTGHDCSFEGWGWIDPSRTWVDTQDEPFGGGGTTTNDQYPNLSMRESSTRLEGEIRKAHWAQWGSSVNSAEDTAEGIWYH